MSAAALNRSTKSIAQSSVRAYSVLARPAAARTRIPAASRVAAIYNNNTARQPIRGVKTLDFAGTKEVVYERSDWPIPKLQEYFKNDTLALIGYGSQGN